MARGAIKDRLDRLEQLTSLLKSDSELTVAGIAEEFGVSARTISRDLAILKEQGLPIDADRGRGGGVRLDRRWGVGRLSLSYAEAVDLLVSLAVAEQMNSPIFMAHLAPVRRKLMASFSSDMKRKVQGLKARILVGESASPEVYAKSSAPGKAIVHALHQSFLTMRQLDIDYRAVNGRRTSRRIEPHYLLLTYPTWYVIGWDHLRGDVRTFRADRISRAALSEADFKLAPPAKFERAIEGIEVI